MTEFEHFAAAPIVEALLDIRAVLPESVDQVLLGSFQQRVGKDYPTKEVRSTWTSQVELRHNAEPVTRSSSGPIGWLF